MTGRDADLLLVVCAMIQANNVLRLSGGDCISLVPLLSWATKVPGRDSAAPTLVMQDFPDKLKENFRNHPFMDSLCP